VWRYSIPTLMKTSYSVTRINVRSYTIQHRKDMVIILI
jgi:hypothetical protein